MFTPEQIFTRIFLAAIIGFIWGKAKKDPPMEILGRMSFIALVAVVSMVLTEG